jgi:hypothetical protein
LPHSYLSGFTSTGSGHFHRAAEEGLKAIKQDPDFAIGYENVAFAYIYQNRLSEAEVRHRNVGSKSLSTRYAGTLSLF